MKVNWNRLYKSRGPNSGPGSRGHCATLKQNAISQAIKQLKAKSILDVGCGDLHILDKLDFSGITYLGIDQSEVLIEQVKNNPNGLRVEHADFLNATFSQKFDLILALDLLIHVEDSSEYRLIVQKLLRTAAKGILISGFTKNSRATQNSSVISFQESIVNTFTDLKVEVIGEYRGTTLILVLINEPKKIGTIWSYWENPAKKQKPAYLDLCEETWHYHCSNDFNIVNVTPENVREFVPDLLPEWDKIPTIAHKADFLRALLVHNYGGIWLDKDIIVLRNLKPFFHRMELENSDFVGCGRPGNRPSNGVFGALKGSMLLKQYVTAMTSLIKSRKNDLKFKWTELSYHTLWPLAKNYNYFQYPFRKCIPIHPAHQKVFFQNVFYRELTAAECDIRNDTYTVYLYNAMFPDWFKEMPLLSVIRGPMVISQLFRRALDIDNPKDFYGENEIFLELSNLTHRNQIPKALQSTGLNRRICEIGVRTGRHLESIAKNAGPSQFVGIDPWNDGGVPSRNDAGASREQQQKWEQSCRRSLEKFGRRGKIVKDYSFNAVEMFPDSYFDFVYIDADHSFDAVTRDLSDWYKKVRPGGVLAGHDYLKRKMHLVEYGVIEAVDSFVRENDLQKNFTTTDERFASWIILKPTVPPKRSFCYWTIATGNSNIHAMAKGLVKSAREAGVNEDIHVFTDPGIEIDGCFTHIYRKNDFHFSGYMFKFKVFEEVALMDYDYFVFLDADSFFVRKPGMKEVSKMLELAAPFHSTQAAQINQLSEVKPSPSQNKWWGIPLSTLTAEFDGKGLIGKNYYSNNGGFFVVNRTSASEVIDAVWEGFDHFYKHLGYLNTADEIGISYAMAKLTDPTGHWVGQKGVSDIWYTDRGAYRGRLPDGKPFRVWTNWERKFYTVDPAIVHARKSKPQLIEFGS